MIIHQVSRRKATGIALAMTVFGGFAASHATRQGSGQTSPSRGDFPEVVREVTLDAKAGAVLHLSFLVSGALVDGESHAVGRVASIVGFTTVQDHIQYDLFHGSPLLPVEGKEPFVFEIGYEEGEASGEFQVTLRPTAPLTWGGIRDVSDLDVSTTRY